MIIGDLNAELGCNFAIDEPGLDLPQIVGPFALSRSSFVLEKSNAHNRAGIQASATSAKSGDSSELHFFPVTPLTADLFGTYPENLILRFKLVLMNRSPDFAR